MAHAARARPYRRRARPGRGPYRAAYRIAPVPVVPSPRGLAQRALYEALDEDGLSAGGWSVGLWDWNWGRPREADALADRLARRAHAGDIVVIHDGHHADPHADQQYTVDATARLIPALRARQMTVRAASRAADWDVVSALGDVGPDDCLRRVQVENALVADRFAHDRDVRMEPMKRPAATPRPANRPAAAGRA